MHVQYFYHFYDFIWQKCIFNKLAPFIGAKNEIAIGNQAQRQPYQDRLNRKRDEHRETEIIIWSKVQDQKRFENLFNSKVAAKFDLIRRIYANALTESNRIETINCIRGIWDLVRIFRIIFQLHFLMFLERYELFL